MELFPYCPLYVVTAYVHRGLCVHRAILTNVLFLVHGSFRQKADIFTL